MMMKRFRSRKGDKKRTLREFFGEAGTITISFVLLIPLILGCIGIGVDSSVHAYFQQHTSNILDTAVKGGAQYVNKNGTINTSCAYGAAIYQYEANRENVAARVPVPDVPKTGEVLSSNAAAIGITPRSCSLSNYGSSTVVHMSSSPSQQYVIKSFSVTQPTVNATGQITPGNIKMCVREPHKTFFLGIFMSKYRTLDTTICSSASNILAK